jgi:hypothetical protein
MNDELWGNPRHVPHADTLPSLSLVFATQTRNVRIQSIFDEQSVLMNTFGMWITPKAIQDLLDELEA